MEQKTHKFSTIKEAKMFTSDDGKRILQLTDSGGTAILNGAEINALASLVRDCGADAVAEVQDISIHACPHCGGEARLFVIKWRDADNREPAICRVQCTVCGARTKDVEDETLADVNERGDKDAKRRAIYLWNMRK